MGKETRHTALILVLLALPSMGNGVAAVPSLKQKLPLLPVFLLFATVLKCKWCSLSFPLLSEWFCITASQVSSRPLSPLTPVKQVRLLKVLGVTLQWHELRIKPAVSNLPVLWLETWLLVAVQLFLSHGCAFWMASDDNYLWLLALEAAEEEISVFVSVFSCLVTLHASTKGLPES